MAAGRWVDSYLSLLKVSVGLQKSAYEACLCLCSSSKTAQKTIKLALFG